MVHTGTHAHQRITHLAQVVHKYFYNIIHHFAQMLLTKTIACMVYTCVTQRPLSCMHMHSAVAPHNDVYTCVNDR